MMEIQERNVVVNGCVLTTFSENLNELLSELGYSERTVATALNGEFIAIPKRREISVQDGDAIEIVSARQGG